MKENKCKLGRHKWDERRRVWYDENFQLCEGHKCQNPGCEAVKDKVMLKGVK